MIASFSETDNRVNWRQVGAFVALTFGLTWALDAAIALTVGYRSPAFVLLLQLQMLMPAFSAILLGSFFFTDSPIYRRVPLGSPRHFFTFFLVYTIIYMILGWASIAAPQQSQLFSTLGLALTILGLLFILLLRVRGGRQQFGTAGLAGGNPRYWLLFGVAVLLFYSFQTLLNSLLGLGHPADLSALTGQTGMSDSVLLLIAAVQSVVVGPLIALPIAFGEEYGWRGYLQGELVKLGKMRGVLLVGTIWGLWHAPIIAMGHNYPGHPVEGILLMVAYCIGLGYFLGFAVLKSGSVWLAAFLHGLNNQALGYLSGLINTPNDPVYSFGVGIYGMVPLAIVTLLILRDHVWKESTRAGTVSSRLS